MSYSIQCEVQIMSAIARLSNKSLLLICNSHFNFRKFCTEKYASGDLWLRLASNWLKSLGSNRKQSTCLASKALWLWVCMCMHVASCPLAQRPAGCKPFICSIIQPEAIPFDTHIPHGTPILSWQHSALWPDGRVSFKTPALLHVSWHMQISSWYASPSLFHQQWYTHIHPHPVLCETRSRRAPLKSFDAVIWQFLADFSLTFGFDQLIWITPAIYHLPSKGCQQRGVHKE